jgi:Holliday junction resolvase RusA-like endonuclease
MRAAKPDGTTGGLFWVAFPTWPISTNQRYRVGTGRDGKAHLYVTTEGRQWQIDAANMTRAKAAADGRTFARRREFSVEIIFDVPGRMLHRVDIDGAIKPTLDAVCKGLDLNDAWASNLTVQKRRGEDWGVIVSVTQRTIAGRLSAVGVEGE